MRSCELLSPSVVCPSYVSFSTFLLKAAAEISTKLDKKQTPSILSKVCFWFWYFDLSTPSPWSRADQHGSKTDTYKINHWKNRNGSNRVTFVHGCIILILANFRNWFFAGLQTLYCFWLDISISWDFFMFDIDSFNGVFISLWCSSKYFPRYKESKYDMTQTALSRFRDFKLPYISEPYFKKFKMEPVGL